MFKIRAKMLYLRTDSTTMEKIVYRGDIYV